MVLMSRWSRVFFSFTYITLTQVEHLELAQRCSRVNVEHGIRNVIHMFSKTTSLSFSPIVKERKDSPRTLNNAKRLRYDSRE